MKKSINQYYIAYERDEKGGYVASVPAIPGCVVYGKTIKEAYSNVQSAVKECLEVIREFKKKTPKETIKSETIKELSFIKVPDYA